MGVRRAYDVVKRRGLPASWEVLSPAGRVVAITYTPTEAAAIAAHLGAGRSSKPLGVSVADLELVAQAADAWADELMLDDVDEAVARVRAFARQLAADRCPHGVRNPHPCRECEDAPSAPVEARTAILDALNRVHAEGRAGVESNTADIADRLAALAAQQGSTGDA